jgi:hypothetical protein
LQLIKFDEATMTRCAFEVPLPLYLPVVLSRWLIKLDPTPRSFRETNLAHELQITSIVLSSHNTVPNFDGYITQ